MIIFLLIIRALFVRFSRWNAFEVTTQLLYPSFLYNYFSFKGINRWLILWPESYKESHREEIIWTQRWSRTTRFYPQAQTEEDFSRKLPNKDSTNRLWSAGQSIAGRRDPAMRSGYRKYCLRQLEARQGFRYHRKRKRDPGVGIEFEIRDLRA